MRLKEKDIELVLFDLDDTLLETNRVFQRYIIPVLEKVSKEVGVELSEFTKVYQESFLKSRAKYHVEHIPLWTYLFEILRTKYPKLSKKFSESMISELLQIYKTPIELKPGAIEVLAMIENMGIKKGLVTNAAVDWTWFKIDKAGISRFFSDENVEIIAPNIKKGTIHWKNAIERQKKKRENTVIIGDNFKADILPAIELKSVPVYLYEKDNNATMHAFGREEFPDVDIIEIDSLENFTQLVS